MTARSFMTAAVRVQCSATDAGARRRWSSSAPAPRAGLGSNVSNWPGRRPSRAGCRPGPAVAGRRGRGRRGSRLQRRPATAAPPTAPRGSRGGREGGRRPVGRGSHGVLLLEQKTRRVFTARPQDVFQRSSFCGRRPLDVVATRRSLLVRFVCRASTRRTPPRRSPRRPALASRSASSVLPCDDVYEWTSRVVHQHQRLR